MSDWCYSMISGHWPTKRLCLIGVTVWYLCTGPQRDSVWLVLQNDTWELIHKTDQQRNVTVWYLHGHWLKQRLCLIGVTVWYLDTGPQRDCVWLVLQYDIWTLAHKETVSDWCYSMISGHWPTKRLCLIGVTVWYLDTGPQRDCVWLVLQYDIWTLAHKETVSDWCYSMISGHWPTKRLCLIGVTVWYLGTSPQRLYLIGVTVWYLNTGPQRDCVWLVLQYDIWALAHKETVSDWCYSKISWHWFTQSRCLIGCYRLISGHWPTRRHCLTTPESWVSSLTLVKKGTCFHSTLASSCSSPPWPFSHSFLQK